MMKNWLLALFGSDGARHAAGAAQEMPLGGELGRQVGQLAAAGAGAGRVAALRHEALDHAVERRAVVEALRAPAS